MPLKSMMVPLLIVLDFEAAGEVYRAVKDVSAGPCWTEALIDLAIGARRSGVVSAGDAAEEICRRPLRQNGSGILDGRVTRTAAAHTASSA
jgi:hypothetical protein